MEADQDPQGELFAAFLERYHATGADPEEFFVAHPEHAEKFRRWWHHLESSGELLVRPADGPASGTGGDAGARLGNYVLKGELGTGSQGTVHLAEDTRLRRRVALKVLAGQRGLRPDAMRRFRREAEMASRLEHPGLCTVYETGESDGNAFIAMRYVEGDTLADWIARARADGRPPPVDETLELVAKVAEALHAAHEAKLIHRDIKPGNIMVGREGQPVILDFGLAREATDVLELTRTGDLLGTPAYMSPEQLAANRIPLDERTDVYSLGVTLYECLTLHRPFDAPTQAQIYQRILTVAPPDPRRWNRRISRELRIVLETVLAKDRDLRYRSALAFAEDLRRVQRGETILARSPDPLTRLWRWARRRPAAAASVFVTATSLLGGTGISLALYLHAHQAERALERLADVAALRAAVAEEETLHPARAELVPRLTEWLAATARPLAARLPLHRARLAELTALAKPQSEEDRARDRATHPDRPRLERLEAELAELRKGGTDGVSATMRELFQARAATHEQEIAAIAATLHERRTFAFDDIEKSYEHHTLLELVRDLERFVGPRGAVARVEQRLQWAREVRGKSIEAYARQWEEARAFVAQSSVYGQRTLPAQVGLVPLGPDPLSGLLEFAHLRSGAMPVRDARGGYEVGPETGIVLVLLPAGRFWMGAAREAGKPGFDPDAQKDEGPVVEVELDWFFAGKHELTRGQWARLSGGENPTLTEGWFLEPHPDVHPVTHVSWQMCDTLLRREGLCLPTEAQWEYAARGGARTPFWSGDAVRSLRGGVNMKDASWVRMQGAAERPLFDDTWPLTAPVDRLRANGFGLHHVAGNVSEWCREFYFANQPGGFVHGPVDGERVVAEVGRRAVRGGSYVSGALQLRCAARGGRSVDQRTTELGVRPARVVER